MGNLVGGNDYCDNLWTMLTGGNYQGSDELMIQAVAWYDARCRDHDPQM